MQNKHEVLTMEQLHKLINDACNSIDIAHKTKVKLRKIINNEEFEFVDLEGIMITGEGRDVIFDFEKVVYMRWSEYFKKALIVARNTFKIEQLKYLEEAHLMVDIECDENNSDEEKRNSLHDFLEYKFKKNMTFYTIKLLEETDIMEFIEAQFLFEYNENREYTTIEGFLNSFGERLFSVTEDFCSINKISLDVRKKLLKVAKVHYLLTLVVIKDCQRRLVEGSNYVEIVDSLKSLYDQELQVKPREKGFRDYLEDIFEVHNLYLDDVLMRHLSKYVISEKEKNLNFIQEAKEKQQTVIDITPHQTLSIGTTSATVENKNLVLFQREIALIYHYENWLLTDENANNEVSKYLQKDGTRHKSGKALMADYRIVNGEFTDWLNQKVTIKYLKKIIPLLQNPKGINDAEEDLRQAIKNRESLF